MLGEHQGDSYTTAMSRQLIIYNPHSGDHTYSKSTFKKYAVPVVSIKKFSANPAKYLSPQLQQVAIVGGDGTHFSVLSSLISHLPAQRKLSVLLYGAGTENVAASWLQTVPSAWGEDTLLADFLAEKLQYKKIKPFRYSTESGITGYGFWSVAVGGIGPRLLKYLESFREVQHPGWRKTLATVLFFSMNKRLRVNKMKAADGAVRGFDVAYVSTNFPFWPKLVEVQQAATHDSAAADYLLRIGKPGQSRWQTLMGLILDVMSLRWRGEVHTKTIAVVPVQEAKVKILSSESRLVVDSEVIELEQPEQVTIERSLGKNVAQVHVAYRSG